MTGTLHSLAVTLSVLGFYSSYLASALLYPGGTWKNARAAGYSFWNNYLCDVLQPTALSGLPNPGSIYGLIAFGLLSLALLFWCGLLVKLLAKYSRKLTRVVVMAAFLSALGVFLSIAFPAEEELLGHHFAAVLMAVLCGLVASLLSLITFLKVSAYRSLGRIGLILISPAILGLGYYIVCNLAFTSFLRKEILLVSLQKVAAIAVSILFLLTARKYAQVAGANNGASKL